MEKPIEPKFVETMKALAGALHEMFNGSLPVSKSKVGFALLVFGLEEGKDKRTNYICNCERADMLNAMKEFIARAEGRITDAEALQ